MDTKLNLSPDQAIRREILLLYIESQRISAEALEIDIIRAEGRGDPEQFSKGAYDNLMGILSRHHALRSKVLLLSPDEEVLKTWRGSTKQQREYLEKQKQEDAIEGAAKTILRNFQKAAR